MMYKKCFVLIALAREAMAFTAIASSTRQSFLSLSSLSGPGSNQDLSGGIFFDGSNDFKVDQSFPSDIDKSSSGISRFSKEDKVKGLTANRLSKRNRPKTIPKDVVIIGAGLAGLSAALHISLHSNRQVTILDKEDPFQQMEKTTAGSFAAAGMLAPQSERLPSGPLLDLCLRSRDMYSDFVQEVESITSSCGDDAKKYLWSKNTPTDGLEPWEVGYSAKGGFLAPAFAGDSVATWSPPAQTGASAVWLDDIQVHEMEPSLHPEVIGGWWFPEDASVDARRLTCALRAACAERGVQFMCGEGCAAGSLELGGGNCKGIKLDDGRTLSASSVVVANGSWMRNLLPVPITPHKGQSFSVRMPADTEPVLSRVLFAQDTYIVPKVDGRIVIGATVEAGSFDPNVTPAGLMHCMSNALQLVPGLGDLPVEETWAGLRPTTPDKGPILGRTKWDNLFIAGGYWRNGVLLAPKTGQLIGDLVLNKGASLDDTEDEELLEAFKWDRFTVAGGGKALAANTRYAASMHPVHKRSSGMGVAAAVGTELGFYSGASDAAEERKRDRESLFQDFGISDNEEDVFELAAKQGLSDSTAFSYSSKVEKPRKSNENTTPDPITTNRSNYAVDEKKSSQALPFDGAPDAFTVGVASSSSSNDESSSLPQEKASKSHNLESVYKNIRKNKAENSSKVEMAQSENDTKPDPGFRIFHVDSITRKETEVPPYTSPMKSKAVIEKNDNEKTTANKANSVNELENKSPKMEAAEVLSDGYDQPDNYDETTFDGYQTIQSANSRNSRDEELEAMKNARMANRVKSSKIDESMIGVILMEDTEPIGKKKKKTVQKIPNNHSSNKNNDENDNKVKDLSDIYSKIQANKHASATNNGFQMQKTEPETKLDPGFRITHVNRESREKTIITPYTSPGSFKKEIDSNVFSQLDVGSEAWGE
uniref:FAD dependent oxidoreductase domain-containing protein n=1 Tax=Chaetoceros debilis TaxID=122233 RepID=A0A7S3Q2W1_9STRA